MSSSKRILKSVATVTVFAIITRSLSFVFKMYLSHSLGAETVGLYQICLTLFFLFSSVCASGLPTVLSRKLAEKRSFKKDDNGAAAFTSALIIGAGMAAITIGALYALRPFLGGLFEDERAMPLFYVMLPALATTTVYCIIRAWFWGCKQFLYFSITETVEEVLRILFTILFVSVIFANENGAYGIALAFTVSDITVAIILITMFFAKGGRLGKPIEIKEIAKPAVSVTAMRVFGGLIGTLTAIILPSRLMSGGMSVNEATAAFGQIAGMANPLLFAPNAIITSMTIVLIPEMSENGIKNNMRLLNRQINGGLSFAVVISGLFMVIYAALGSELTTLLFNDTVSGEYLEVACFLMLFMPLNQITASTLNSIAMEKEAFAIFSVSTVFMMLALWFLPPYVGIYSVVIANAASLLISVLGNILFLKKRTALQCDFLLPTLKVALFSLPSIYLTSTVYSLASGALGLFALVLACAAGAAMYAVLALTFGLVDIELIKAKKKRKLPTEVKACVKS